MNELNEILLRHSYKKKKEKRLLDVKNILKF